MVNVNIIDAAIGPSVTERSSGAPADRFRETVGQFASRQVLGLAFALRGKRVGNVPFLLGHAAVDLLRGGTTVPDASRIAQRPDGFAGLCRNVTADTVMAAARGGFYPFCHIGPLKWWMPAERMVIKCGDHHISKNLRRDMRRLPYSVTFDRAFADVVRECAGKRSYNSHSLTWITPQIARLYTDLHHRGLAHSFEVWGRDGDLIGGGYGLAVGRIFFTESLFSRQPHTSKMGFALLNHHLSKWGFLINDGKAYNPTLADMGFKLIPRVQFREIMAEHGQFNLRPGKWDVETDLATIAAPR